MDADGYSWSGSLDETDIRSLYATCQSLRFSGQLELRDGPTQAQVQFVAGEPVEITGGDTQRIALWNRGTFHATQSIPNLAGELTGALEMQGSLADTKASALWAWISEYRLSCEINLDRPGSNAVVVFQNGHAESAHVNGQPELAALARVSSWTDGTFRVKLRPLFVDGAMQSTSPAILEGAPPTDPRQFDVSRSIPMDLKNRMPSSPAEPVPVSPSVLSRGVTPALGELVGQQGPPKRPMPPPPPRSAVATPIPPGVQPAPGFDLSPPRKKSKAPWIVLVLSLLIGGGVGAAYYLHLPPFSPPPTPVAVEPTPTPKTELPPQKPVEAKPAEEPIKPLPPPEPEKPEVTAAEKAATKQKPPPVEKPAPPAPPVEKEKPVVAAKEPKEPKEKPGDKYIEKGRLLLIEGHAHSALEQLKKAEKLRPKDAAIKTYELQAMGKMGFANLEIEKGTVSIDGHKFTAPKKVRLAAGPHNVDLGDGEKEMVLKKGEKKKLKARK